MHLVSFWKIELHEQHFLGEMEEKLNKRRDLQLLLLQLEKQRWKEQLSNQNVSFV